VAPVSREGGEVRDGIEALEAALRHNRVSLHLYDQDSSDRNDRCSK
jgi:hypothetical protein